MLEQIPDEKAMVALLGQSLYDLWAQLCLLIDEKYDMEHLWNSGGRAWTYEYKYRRGGKTLCALYARENCVGFMVILGKSERQKFEVERQDFSEECRSAYDGAQTYHDGKWIMFEPKDDTLFGDFIKLLMIKRKPNKKQLIDPAKKLPRDEELFFFTGEFCIILSFCKPIVDGEAVNFTELSELLVVCEKSVASIYTSGCQL